MYVSSEVFLNYITSIKNSLKEMLIIAKKKILKYSYMEKFKLLNLSLANSFKILSGFCINSSLFSLSIDNRARLCKRFPVMVDLFCTYVLIFLIVEKLLLAVTLEIGITKIHLHASSSSKNDIPMLLIEVTILKGKYKGEDVLILCISMIPTDVPFEFKRLQFPVRLAFAMTINKSQGQSLSVCGINLENPCFSHGQLYVACFRVGKPSDLFVYAPGSIFLSQRRRIPFQVLY
ncbi:hypothetical protein QTP88_003330 [Uroleucon formosanum]